MKGLALACARSQVRLLGMLLCGMLLAGGKLSWNGRYAPVRLPYLADFSTTIHMAGQALRGLAG